MNKLRKMALMVVGQNLAPDDVAGACLWRRGVHSGKAMRVRP